MALMGCIGLLPLSLGFTPLVAQVSRASDRQAITEGESAWGRAFVTGDVATVKRLLTDDVLGVTDSGRAYDKAAALKTVSLAKPGGSDQTGPLKIVFHGDTAVVQGLERDVDPPPQGKTTQIIFTDTWMKRDGRWRIVAAQDTRAPGV